MSVKRSSFEHYNHILCSVPNLLVTGICLHFRNVSTWLSPITRNMRISESWFYFPTWTSIEVFLFQWGHQGIISLSASRKMVGPQPHSLGQSPGLQAGWWEVGFPLHLLGPPILEAVSCPEGGPFMEPGVSREEGTRRHFLPNLSFPSLCFPWRVVGNHGQKKKPSLCFHGVSVCWLL